MKFHAIMPVLKVRELEVSLRFYQDVLGFALEWRKPDMAMLTLDAVQLMVATGSHLGAGPPSFTGTLYFDMMDVDALWEQVKDRVTVVWPLADMEYGTREFGLRDPDGYTLAFSEQVS